MFDYFIGKIVEIEENKVVIEVNSIGYVVYIPTREISSLELGKEYKVYLYRHLYENGEDLYGFIDKDSRKLFVNLMEVNGVGPKLALKILSYLSPSEIVRAIVSEKSTVLSSIKGVSEKTAERIVSELKNTIHKIGIVYEENQTNFEDLVKALRSLGYSQNEILSALNLAKKKEPRLLSIDVSQALQICLSILKDLK